MEKKRKSEKSNKLKIFKPSPATREREENEMLAEFSDGYGDFYVDEVDERRRKVREERDIERESRRLEKKPVSPARRKFMRIVSTFVIVAVIIIVGVILSLTVLFKTQSYEVVGNTLYLESDIIKTCGISEGENIFLAPKAPAEERIERRFPYVDTAKVSFSIPDTIRIEIKQAVEGYLFKVSDTEYLIISTKGRILNRVADISGYQIPIFIGPKLKSGEIGDFVEYEDSTILEIIDSITQTFSDNGYQGITEINATDPANISFIYDGRIRVKIGIPEDISYKIRTAMTIINSNIDINPSSKVTGVLDVSRCNVTKRSYFNEMDITATEPPTENPSETATESVDTYQSDTDYSGSDYSDGSYDGYTGDTYGDYGDYWTPD